MVRRTFLVLALLLAPLLTIPAQAQAADIFRGVCSGPTRNSEASPRDAAVCKDAEQKTDAQGNYENPIFGPQGALTKAINILSLVVGIIAIITIVLAGFKYVISGSNSQDVTNARERVIYSLVALAVAASAQILVRFVVGNL